MGIPKCRCGQDMAYDDCCSDQERIFLCESGEHAAIEPEITKTLLFYRKWRGSVLEDERKDPFADWVWVSYDWHPIQGMLL